MRPGTAIRDGSVITVEKAREKFSVLKVIAPHLDDQMRPAFELRDKSQCPLKRDGDCCKCDKFAGVFSEDGTFFALGLYEGFCDSKDKEAIRVEEKGW